MLIETTLRSPLKECRVKKIYRSPMEKILDEQKRDEIISNPKEPFGTFLRKVRFTVSKWSDKVRRLFRR